MSARQKRDWTKKVDASVYEDGAEENITDLVDGKTNHKNLGKWWTGTTSFELIAPDSQVAKKVSVYDAHLTEEVVEEYEQAVLAGGL